MKHKHAHQKPANLGPRTFANGYGPRHHLGVPCTPQPLQGFQSPTQISIDQNPETK